MKLNFLSLDITSNDNLCHDDYLMVIKNSLKENSSFRKSNIMVLIESSLKYFLVDHYSFEMVLGLYDDSHLVERGLVFMKSKRNLRGFAYG